MATANRDYQAVNGNWDDTANWSGATVPISGVDVRIGGNSVDLDTNITGQSAVALESLFIGETYTGDLGGTGNTLNIDCTDVLTVRSGGNEVWIKGDFPEVHAAPMKQTENALVIETKSAGDINRLFALRGRTTLVAGSDVDDVNLLSGSADSVLVVQAGTTINNDVHVGAGTLDLSGTVSGFVYLYGNGRVILRDGGDINRLFMFGGNFKWLDGEFTFDSSTFPTVLVQGGHFDAHDLVKTHTVPEMWAVGDQATLTLRTGQQNIIRTRSKAIGNPTIILDDGDTF